MVTPDYSGETPSERRRRLDCSPLSNTGNTMPVLSFKVSPEEARRIRSRARTEKTSVSAFLRKSALGEETPRARIVRKIHPVSGLPYNAARGRVATEEQIRAALADFP